MVIEKITFKSTDGTEFDSKEEAIAHEQVDEAYKAYQDAVKALNIAIAEKLVTADGVPFKIGGRTHYSCILGQFSSGRPIVRDFAVDYWTFQLEPNNFSTVKGSYFDGDKRVDAVFEVAQLYAKEENAWQEVLESLDSKKQGLDSYAEIIKQRCL
jgi:hypothetical protein